MKDVLFLSADCLYRFSRFVFCRSFDNDDRRGVYVTKDILDLLEVIVTMLVVSLSTHIHPE